MWFEFSAGVTEEIDRAEEGNIPVRFYNLKSGCYQGFHTCEGDVLVTINALADYADIIMEFIAQSDYGGYRNAFYELHAERCRKISKKLQEQIGYDRDAAIDRCREKKKYFGKNSDNDVGEDALVMAVKKSREKQKKERDSNGQGEIRRKQQGVQSCD